MPRNTKENILLAALRLFAQNGYEAVSVSDIAGALGVTKGALYKHYANKRAIFESIVARMEALDAQGAQAYEMPEGTVNEMEDAYRHASMKQIVAFGCARFHDWTEDDFHASFRKMLTLEQYRSAEMRALYQQYLVSGPLGYVADLFRAWNMPNAQERALAFYAPMFLLYSIADGAEDKAAAAAMLKDHMRRLCAEWGLEE